MYFWSLKIITRKWLMVLSIWWQVTVHTCYVFKQIVDSVNSIYNRQFRSIVTNIMYRFIISLPVTRLITGNPIIQNALLHGFWVLRHKVNIEIWFSICRHQRLGMFVYLMKVYKIFIYYLDFPYATLRCRFLFVAEQAVLVYVC